MRSRTQLRAQPDYDVGRNDSSHVSCGTSANEIVVVGEVAAPSGLKGDVRIRSFTRPVTGIFDYRRWILGQSGPADRKWAKPGSKLGGAERIVTLVRGRRSGKNLVASLAGIETREQAEALAGLTISIDREQLPEPGVGEYYWDDLVGLVVRNLDGEALGVVDHLVETGANDVLVLAQTGNPADRSNPERLVPWIDSVIVSVDLENGSLTVDWDSEF